jgi:Arabinose efflux permease
VTIPTGGALAPQPRSRAGLTVASLSLGTALNPLNSSMIAVALVELQRHFVLSVSVVTWVITVFYLASAAGQPLMGRLADRFGPRRLFLFGMVVVAIVCALTPFAPSFALVCVGRVLLAIGTATAFPSAIAMMGAITRGSGTSTPRLLGRVQIANTAGAAVGPVLGGVLVSTLGWPAIFWVNVPLAVLAFLGVLAFAPRDAPRERQPLRTIVAASDIPGILAFIATLVALLVFLLDLRPTPLWWLLPVAAAAGALFVWRELTCRTPFLNLRLLAANRPLMMVYLCFAVFNLIYYCAFFGLPQFLQEHGGYSAGVAGILMFPLAAVTIVVTPLAARAIERRGVRVTLLTGGATLVAGAAVLAVAGATTAPATVLLITAAMGVPYCIVSIAMNQALYASARPEDAGVAAGMFQTSRYIGAILATTLIGVAFAGGTTPPNWLVVIGVATVLSVVHLGLLIAWRPSRSRPA